MYMYILYVVKYVVGGRRTIRTTAVKHIILRPPHAPLTAVVQSPFPFNLKRDIFRAKNQYDKMEEKSCVERKKQYTSIEGQGHVARKKNVPRNGRINVSKQKKKLNSDFWKTIMKELISFNFLCFQREFYPKFKPFLLC